LLAGGAGEVGFCHGLGGMILGGWR
jgi:hypothetical protein